MTEAAGVTAPAEQEIVVTARRSVRVDTHGPVARPAWRVTMDGVDLSEKIAPRLMRLRVAERRGELADQLDIDLDASDGALALPPAGAVLNVELGWIGGGGTTPGLVDRGAFIVDEVEHSGPPDVVVIRARSADFTAEWRKVRDQSYRDTTLGAVLNIIAGRQGLAAKIAPDLAAYPIAMLAQSRENDLTFFMRLGTEYDAIATVKNRTLIFVPMAGGKTAGGNALPKITVRREQGGSHSYRIEAREDYTGVVAKWHDKKAAKQKTTKAQGRAKAKGAVPKSKAMAKSKAATKPKTTHTTTAGTADNPKNLKKVYATEAEAKRAATAEWQRIQRAPRKLTVSLALGRPEIGVDQPVVAVGYHPDIDAQDWIVTDATHTLEGKGLTTALSLEVPDNPAEGDGGEA